MGYLKWISMMHHRNHRISYEEIAVYGVGMSMSLTYLKAYQIPS
jgi:hypothetical protein